VIAEIKRRSPSKGDLAPDLDPVVTAKAYETGGAAALSVLTDQLFFGGSVDDLRSAREATAVPVLRKDFTIDETQVLEARAIGADALLLIVAAVPDDALLADLHAFAGDLGLTALVEVHDEVEVDRALAAGAIVVGVNCRDLGTFAEDLGVAERLVRRLPPEVIAVAESAIRAPADAGRMAAAGFDAVLVGEALVRSPDPAALVGELAAIPAAPRPQGDG
jgi:indole-3-glycerol phosphate synthase